MKKNILLLALMLQASNAVLALENIEEIKQKEITSEIQEPEIQIDTNEEAISTEEVGAEENSKAAESVKETKSVVEEPAVSIEEIKVDEEEAKESGLEAKAAEDEDDIEMPSEKEMKEFVQQLESLFKNLPEENNPKASE